MGYSQQSPGEGRAYTWVSNEAVMTNSISTRYIRSAVVLGSLILSSFALAQDPTQFPTRGWPRAGDPQLNQGGNAQLNFPDAQAQPPAGARDQFGSPVGPGPAQGVPAPRAVAPVPAQLTLKAGTYVTVRVDQPLSSDHNQQGDAFSATLVRPVVIDGIVVAQSGQLVTGRVVEAQKAGRVEGTSRLRVQLVELGLADGQQVPIQTEMINRSGPTSVGRDAAAIGGTTALGAAVGAAADWGRGAAIGAGAGAAVGILGVLLTRGQPTIIYPESVLTFRIDSPVTIATDRAPEAFRYVDTSMDYNRPYAQGPPPPRPGPGYGYPPPPPYYPGVGYPYPYYGPSVGVIIGPGFRYGRGYYYGRGFYGRGFWY